MKDEDGPMFRAKEFADLAGVTVRTLHHYDRLGLLKPRRAESGYRLYRESDLERLEQIVALKFLGLPLKEIRELLDSAAPDLPAALRMQRSALERSEGCSTALSAPSAKLKRLCPPADRRARPSSRKSSR